MNNVGDLVRSVSRPVDPDKLSVFSIFRDERAFCPAFFAHYRSLGVEQFVIIDDGSKDGTREWLEAQRDAIVVQMRFGFGTEILTKIGGRRKTDRAGTYYKIALPNHFFDGQYVTYVDADEFLLLPPGVSSLRAVVDTMAARGERAVLASVVEFFPAELEGLSGQLPDSFSGLIENYSWFQEEAIISPRAGTISPEFLAPSKTARLYADHGIEPPLVRRGWHRLWMPSRVAAKQRAQTSPRYKTPIILRDADSWQVGSHAANTPPAADRLLTIAHFVFTAELRAKTERAIARAAHAHGGRKYRGYAMLLDTLAARGDGFLDANSRRFDNVEQLCRAGIMRWPD